MNDVDITVYSKPHCVQCTATYRALDKAGVPYEVVDVSVDAQALEEIKALGFQQAPVVAAFGEYWAGFRPDRVKAAAERYKALHPAESAESVESPRALAVA